MSVILYAMKHNMSYEDAVKAMQRTLGSGVKPWLSSTHTAAAEKAMAQGIMAPSNPMSSRWKLPWYAHGKLGGAPNAGAALDTHEQKRIMQLAMDNPRLAKLARETGADVAAAKNSGKVPLKNGLDHDAVSGIYRAGARDLGLPSPQAFQAGRWIGGGEHTGLKSAPFGDYVQTIEDALLYTARAQGQGESPRELRNLWGEIVSGRNFFALYWGNGGFPIY